MLQPDYRGETLLAIAKQLLLLVHQKWNIIFEAYSQDDAATVVPEVLSELKVEAGLTTYDTGQFDVKINTSYHCPSCPAPTTRSATHSIIEFHLENNRNLKQINIQTALDSVVKAIFSD